MSAAPCPRCQYAAAALIALTEELQRARAAAQVVELKSCKHGFMLSHCGEPPDASASLLYRDLAADIRNELDPNDEQEYRPVESNALYWSLTLPNIANYFDKAADELDRLARELADAQIGVKWNADLAAEMKAELHRALDALRDIASCRTRPPADAIEIACRYWATQKGKT